MNIWDFSERITRRLLIWSVLSVILSLLFIFIDDAFMRGLGIQFFAWGFVDGLIAVYGAKASAKKKLRVEESSRAEVEAKESRWLSRILQVNTGLDILYVLGGLWLLRTWGVGSPLWSGHAIGIIIQGGFLFLFDLYHARTITSFKY